MPKVLTEDAIAQYEREGNFFPIPILCEDEVADLRGRLEAFEAEQGQPIQGGHRNKSHLLFKWLDDLMRNPRILDVVEDLIGRDILCWNTIFWIKEARSPSYVSWHQDLNYWGLDATDLVSAWLALSPATVESGCMRVLPGSHAEEALPHDDTFHVDNMLTRGQEIAVEAFNELFDKVFKEDVAIVENVQRGLASPGYRAGTLMEQPAARAGWSEHGVHHFQDLVD